MKTIEHRLGFTVSYLNKNGTVGFIGIDDASGGYPYFSDGLTPRRIVGASEAMKQLAGLSKEMKGYYGSDKVQLDTMQIVEVVVKTADPVFVDKIVQQELLAKANKTFTPEELVVLKALLK